MKTLILLILGLGLSGCASIPSLFGDREQTKVWHVHPDDMPQFKADQRRCFEIAALAHGDDRLIDSCLQRIGYRLEIVNN